MSLAEPVTQTADPNAPQMPADGGTTNTNVHLDGNAAAPAPEVEKKVHARPIFELKAVGAELPEPPKRTAPENFGGVTREVRFKGDLEQIKADPGTWYELADYGATTTAKRTATYLDQALQPTRTVTAADGHTEQVGGELLDLVADGGSYEFKGQRSDTDPKRSKLYARYVAPTG